ncbi:MlaD family protein [Seohaeicola saemankumensis]|nr:MlaD family protein [Seohaeicola saemankumensis]MCA0869416.1 MlaD family protein [Seohaeicola saemankumensis]
MTGPAPADLDVTPARPSFWRNLSLVWLVPVLALVVSLGLAWNSFAQRGVLIEITFASASGISPGETTLRFRDVTIGTVEDVGFTPDLASVVVKARVNKEVAPFLDADAQFWVVSPKVSARGITGLSTVLSGVYIEGAWDKVAGTPLRSFIGRDAPPLVQPGREGKRITLISDNGRLLAEGAPVFFRGVEVGRLERPRLTVSTDMIVVDAFIEAPHDRRMNTATRFWDTSGFEVSLSGAGLSVDFDSLSSLVAGGVEFDSIYEGGTPVSPGYVYTVYPDEGDARKSLFLRSTAASVDIAAEFGESVSGLEPGADVRLGGLKVGEVVAIAAQVQETEFGPELRPMARLAIEPDRLGLPRGAGREATLDFLETAVAAGLRAQLATTSLFSRALVVDLVNAPDAAPATFQRDAEPLPILPSAVSNLPDFTATAEGVFERINALPVEELIEQAINTLASVEAVARKDSLLTLPDTVVALLEDARAVVNDEATRALPGEIRGAVRDLRATVQDFNDSEAIAKLVLALDKADAIATNLAQASESVPELVEELRAVAQKANALKAEDLIAAATQMLDSAEQVIGTEAARALPASLNAALDQVRGALDELRSGGAVENANATMASARDAADALAEAAAGLPDLSARLDRLAAQAETLLSAYGTRSDFNKETLSALREVRDAARAVSQLARALERDPGLLLRGR